MPHTNNYRTEDDLLAGLRRSEPAAFEAFFDRYADRIYGFGLKVAGDADAAKEILQDTLVTALKSIKDVKHAKAIPRWLYRVATNACLNRCRPGPEAGNGEIPLEDLVPERVDGVSIPVHDWSLDPEEEVRRDEEKRLLKEVVAGLPPNYRLVLVLGDMEEIAANEISEILQIQVSTVKMRLHRARLLVRKELTRRLLGGGGRVTA